MCLSHKGDDLRNLWIITSLDSALLFYLVYLGSIPAIGAFCGVLIAMKVLDSLRDQHNQTQLIKFYTNTLLALEKAYNIPKWHIPKIMDDIKLEIK